VKPASQIYAEAAAKALREERTDAHKQAKVHMPRLPEPPTIGFSPPDESPLLKALWEIMVAAAIVAFAGMVCKVLGVRL
jgi:hypothetical protein